MSNERKMTKHNLLCPMLGSDPLRPFTCKAGTLLPSYAYLTMETSFKSLQRNFNLINILMHTDLAIYSEVLRVVFSLSQACEVLVKTANV